MEVSEQKTMTEEVKTALYRHYDSDDGLLYVGVSLNHIARLKSHSKHSFWADDIATIKIEYFDSRGEALAAEREAVRNEMPQHNIQHALPPEVPKSKLIEQSRARMIANEVLFNPMYTVQEVGNKLIFNNRTMKFLVYANIIGSVMIDPDESKMSSYRITGWQLIDFMEALTNNNEGMRQQIESIRKLVIENKPNLMLGQADLVYLFELPVDWFSQRKADNAELPVPEIVNGGREKTTYKYSINNFQNFLLSHAD